MRKSVAQISKQNLDVRDKPGTYTTVWNSFFAPGDAPLVDKLDPVLENWVEFVPDTEAN